jgi:hypothetical protein
MMAVDEPVMDVAGPRPARNPSRAGSIRRPPPRVQ